MNKNKIKNILIKILKLLGYIVIALVCFCVAFLVYYIISSQMHANDENYKPAVSIYTIVSPSMTPVINVYDVVVNTRVNNPEDIQVGDIITYVSASPTSEGMTITHRVTFINTLPDGTYEYMTQGDNNSEPDSLYVKYDQVIGKELFVIPLLGRLQFLLANQKGWLFLLLIPVSIYVLYEIYKLIDLFGLRKKVNTVVGTTEESLIERKKEQKSIEKERKIAIKEELKAKNFLIESLNRSESEPEGFLERYTEKTVFVSTNKYKKDTKPSKPIKVNTADIPTKISTGTNLPVREKQEVDLPKIKENPYVLNKTIEILDTDELTSKIKEYDTKIEKLDKMIADMEKIPVKPQKEKEQEEIVEKENYLTKRKIKVKSVEPTKNQKKKAPERKNVPKKEKETIELKTEFKPELTQTIELTQIVNHENKRMKIERPEGEDIKALRERELHTEKKTTKKKNLNLNPKTIKTVSRKTKKTENPAIEKKINVEIHTEPPKKLEQKQVQVKVEQKTAPKKIEPFIEMEKRHEEPIVEEKKKYKPLIEIKKIR